MSTYQFGSADPYLTRSQIGVAGGPVVSDSSGNFPIEGVVAVTNKASGGTIGTAASTVDIAAIITINQTTASQTVTIPSPTTATTGKCLKFINIGSATVTYAGVALTTGTGVSLVWTGAAWAIIGKGV